MRKRRESKRRMKAISSLDWRLPSQQYQATNGRRYSTSVVLVLVVSSSNEVSIALMIKHSYHVANITYMIKWTAENPQGVQFAQHFTSEPPGHLPLPFISKAPLSLIIVTKRLEYLTNTPPHPLYVLRQ
jgi:hypothetical protein